MVDSLNCFAAKKLVRVEQWFRYTARNVSVWLSLQRASFTSCSPPSGAAHSCWHAGAMSREPFSTMHARDGMARRSVQFANEQVDGVMHKSGFDLAVSNPASFSAQSGLTPGSCIRTGEPAASMGSLGRSHLSPVLSPTKRIPGLPSLCWSISDSTAKNSSIGPAVCNGLTLSYANLRFRSNWYEYL